MAQFDFYPYQAGFLFDVQADLMDGLNTRIAVPLLPFAEAPQPASRLNPVFTIGDGRYTMVTQFMTALSLAEMQDRAGSLAHEHFAIKAAIDMIFDGI